MKVEQLQDFNEVAKYYSEILDFVSQIRQNPNNIRTVVDKFIKDEKFSNFSNLAPYRVIASNISLFIAQIQEKTKNMDDKSLLDAAFSKLSYLDNIQSKKEGMTLAEKKRQIRNCLAHADYHLVLQEFEHYDLSNPYTAKADAIKAEIYLQIENKSIKGMIPFDELLEFARKYQESYAYLNHGYDVTLLLTNNQKNGIKTVQDYLKNTKRVRIFRRKDKEGKPFDKFKYWFIRKLQIPKSEQSNIEKLLEAIKEDYSSFDFQEEEVRDKSKEFIKKYIEYIGIRQFLSSPYSSMALNEVNAANNEEVLPIDLLTGITRTLDLMRVQNNLLAINLNYIFDEKYIKTMGENTEKLIKYSFQAPMVYANTLLGMSYYMLDYAREINEQNGKSFFDYYNIQNLDGIRASITDKKGNKKEVPVQVNPLDKLQNRLNDIDSKILKLQKEKETRENTKSNLENPKNKNPRKNEILSSINEWIIEYEKELKRLTETKESIEKEIEQESKKENNKDSSEFFRHLRNSMSHGNYTISYGDFRNVNDIRYSFSDEDEKSNSTYSVELTAKQLRQILEAFQQKVNECDRGYLDGKKMERKIIEQAIKKCGIGLDYISQTDLEEKDNQNHNEREGKNSGEQK